MNQALFPAAGTITACNQELITQSARYVLGWGWTITTICWKIVIVTLLARYADQKFVIIASCKHVFMVLPYIGHSGHFAITAEKLLTPVARV